MSKRRGYSLLELFIVVGMIATLAYIAIPNFLNAQVRSKVTRAQSELNILSLGLESYYLDYGIYPSDKPADLMQWKKDRYDVFEKEYQKGITGYVNQHGDVPDFMKEREKDKDPVELECPNCFHMIRQGLETCPVCGYSLLEMYTSNKPSNEGMPGIHPSMMGTMPLNMIRVPGPISPPFSGFSYNGIHPDTGEKWVLFKVNPLDSKYVWTPKYSKMPDEENPTFDGPYYISYLTSPVNYLSGFEMERGYGFARDVFGYDPDGYDHRYHYLNLMGTGHEADYGGYALSSKGPDLELSEFGISYDPTNGTTSRGDIYVFGK